MKVLLTLLVIILATNIGAAFKPSICPIYTVKKDNNKTCYYEELGKLTLRKCKDGQYCEHMKLNKESVCQDIPKVNLTHGEKCDKDDQCASKKCDEKNKICVGFNETHACNTTAQCGSNLFCNKVENKTNCTKTGISCNEAGEGCNTNQFCYAPNKTCHNYMSKSNNQPAVSSAECKSYYTDDEGKCADRPILEKESCTGGEYSCTYKQGKKSFTIPCLCIRGGDIKKIRRCPIFKPKGDLAKVITCIKHS